VIKIHTATTAKPATAFMTQRPRRERQHDLLPNQRGDVNFLCGVIAQPQVFSLEFFRPAARFAWIWHQDKIEVFIEPKRVVAQTAATRTLKFSLQGSLEKDLLPGPIVGKGYVQKGRKAKIPKFALFVEIIELVERFNKHDLTLGFGNVVDGNFHRRTSTFIQ
jgi:hypothetical protein